MKQVKGSWGYIGQPQFLDEYAIYHRVIRTEFIALWLCSGKSHESGCEAWVLQTYGAYYRPQELGVTVLTQSHLFPTVITPPLQGDYS